jgi:hypothetical protein
MALLNLHSMRTVIVSLTAFAASARGAFALDHEQLHRELSLDFSIGESMFNLSEQVNGTIQVMNIIGSSVVDDGLGVELYSHDCQTKYDKVGSLVEIHNNTDHIQNVSEYYWDIQVVQERLTAGADFLEFLDVDEYGIYKGNIQFCTKVTSWMEGVNIAFLFDQWSVDYDFFNAEFTFTNAIDIPSDSFQTEVSSNLTLTMCQCSYWIFVDTFEHECIMDPTPIKQSERVSFCLFPSIEDPDYVQIKNFNVNLEGSSEKGSVSYDPVMLGPEGTFIVDPLSAVHLAGDDFDYGLGFNVNTTDDGLDDPDDPDDPDSEDENSELSTNAINIVVPVLANFYIFDITLIEITGVAFLEFTQTRGVAGYEGFSTQLSLSNTGDKTTGSETGCFASLVQLVKQLF